MSDNLELKDLPSAIKNALTPLNEYQGHQQLVSTSIDKSISFSLYDASFTINGDAEIALFNSKDDKDQTGILGQKILKPGDLELEPAIIQSPDACWLKYSTCASLKGNASYSAAELGFAIDLEAGITLHSYRAHHPEEQLGATLLSDLTAPKFILDKRDILALASNEAVALETKGKLAVSLTLSWSDVLVQNMSLFSQLLSAGELLNIKLDAALSAAIDVTIEDYYSLTFSRNEQAAGKLQLAVTKSSSRGLDVVAGAEITAAFNHTDDLKNVAAQVLENVFEQPKSAIDVIKGYTDTSELSAIEQKVVDELIDRLGLDATIDKINALQTRLAEIEAKVEKNLIKAIESKATIGVKYEYSRLTKEQALLQAEIPDQLLDLCYGAALKGKLFELTHIVENTAGARLSRFFFQKSTKIEHAFGFNLGFASWSAMSKQYSTVEYIENRDKAGRRQLSMLGFKGYKSRIGSDSRNFFVDFDAVMPKYSQLAEPSADEFEYALNVTHISEENLLDKGELIQAIDDAAVWGLVPQGEVDETLAGLWDELLNSSKVKLLRTMTISHELLVKILPLLAAHDTALFAQALAASLPMIGDKDGRKSPYIRENLYSQLCYDYLTKRVSGSHRLAIYAQNLLKEKGFAALGRWEKRHVSAPNSVVNVLRLHPNLIQDWQNFSQGMSKLNNAISKGGSHKEIGKAFKLFDDFGEHNYYIRSLGHYLSSVVKQLASDTEGFECSLIVEYSKGGKDKKLIIANA